MRLLPAEKLLQELGITEPTEIDLEAIAYYTGALVRYRPLGGCEARIVGRGNRAVITVNEKSHPRRQRFSIAHELGHWYHHRGEHLACNVEDYRPRSSVSPERVADSYAADLLMPNYLFRSLSSAFPKLTLKTITQIAGTFETSKTATVIRLIENDHTPAILVCHGPAGRKWFSRAPSVPQSWFPRDELDPDSYAFDVQFGSAEDDRFPRRIGAESWFDRRLFRDAEVTEQTMRISPSETLTIIVFDDPDLLESCA